MVEIRSPITLQYGNKTTKSKVSLLLGYANLCIVYFKAVEETLFSFCFFRMAMFVHRLKDEA